MATRTSSTFRQQILEAIADLMELSPATTVDLSFHDAAQAANADGAAAPGNLLCTISVTASTAFGAATGGGAGGTGSFAKAGTWSGTVVLTGTALMARLNVNGVIARRIDLSVGLVASGADIEFDDNAFVLDGTVVIDTFAIQMPHTV